MMYDPTTLKITGSLHQARRLQELMEPGQTIFYNSNIEIEVANKGPIDYCLWCVKTQLRLFYFQGDIEDVKVWKEGLPPGIFELEKSEGHIA